jgi:DnaJ-domain-containing protein 1
MPTIHLKPNSPDFADRADKKAAPKEELHCCDYPGCRNSGEHKAPKGRELKDYYIFCKTHAEDYNRAWDFFEGMSAEQVEDHIIRSMHGDRPTWRYDTMARMDAVYRKAHNFYNFRDDNAETHDPGTIQTGNLPPEMEAMKILGLEPPVDLKVIKTQYKKLAMRYHPDRNKDDPGAEEVLKRINYAYTVLKAAYKQYENLPARA